MDEVIFLEVMEGDGVQSRHRLERFPATVGRGYACDVILDDPKVSATHLRLERTEAGAVVVRDVGSTNGTFLVDPWTPLAEVTLAPDLRVAVGDTVLRFRGRSHAVERTFVGAAPESSRKRFFDQPALFPSALAALVLLSVLTAHLGNYHKTDWSELTVALMVPVTVAFFWAGAWSVASRIARRQFHFRAHGSIGGLSMLGITGVPLFLSAATFSLSLGPTVLLLQAAIYLMLLSWTLYWHLRYVTRWSPRRLKFVLAAVFAVFTLMTQADSLLDKEEFSAELPFNRRLLPPALRLAPARSVEDFFLETDGLQRQVDALTQEE
ncbi:FHA domain-containing protein [Myxococcaceae bacterium GXIMD 01537]